MTKRIEEAAKQHATKADNTVILKGEMETHYAERARLSFIEGADFALTHQWRSVEDELPEQCTTVLCVNANADPYCKWCWLSFYVGDIFQDNADSKATFPTHWLPIPSLNPEQR